MNDLIFDFDLMGQQKDKATKKALQYFSRAGNNVVSGDTSPVKRSAGVSYRSMYLTFADGQQVELQIKKTGDIFAVKVNGKPQPIKNQGDHTKAIAEISKVLDAGRAKFQKAQSMKKAELPKGIKSAAPKIADTLKARIGELDTQIAEAKVRRDELKSEIGEAMDSVTAVGGDGKAMDSTEEDEEDDTDADEEWENTPEVDEDEAALDGDFKGHPFRGNQHRKASKESGAAVSASIRAKKAEKSGDGKALKSAHKTAYHAHAAAAESATTKKAKGYHKKMAKFHGGHAGVAMDGVIDRIPDANDRIPDANDRIPDANDRIESGDDSIEGAVSEDQGSLFDDAALDSVSPRLQSYIGAIARDKNEKKLGKITNITKEGGKTVFTIDDDYEIESGRFVAVADLTHGGGEYIRIDDTIAGKALDATKSNYATGHRTFSEAVQEARDYAEKNVYEVDGDDWHERISVGPRKPDEGKTNRYTIGLKKDGKEQKKALQIQVYGKGESGYELNCYIA